MTGATAGPVGSREVVRRRLPARGETRSAQRARRYLQQRAGGRQGGTPSFCCEQDPFCRQVTPIPLQRMGVRACRYPGRRQLSRVSLLWTYPWIAANPWSSVAEIPGHRSKETVCSQRRDPGRGSGAPGAAAGTGGFSVPDRRSSQQNPLSPELAGGLAGVYKGGIRNNWEVCSQHDPID